MSEPHLVAHVVNAKSLEDCEVVYDIAFLNPQSEWETNFGEIVLPFWRLEISNIVREWPPIPEGWIDHIHVMAQKQASAKRDAMRPSGLAALLARTKPAPTPTIPRRGF